MSSQPTIDDYSRSEFNERVKAFFEQAAKSPHGRLDVQWGGQELGVWEKGTRKYIIFRRPEAHFFRKTQSYGISEIILVGLRSQGVQSVELVERGKTGARRYVANIELFFNAGIKHKNENSPHELQIHLPLRLWTPTTSRWKPSDTQVKVTPEYVRNVYP